MSDELKNQIMNDIKSNNVILYMKGTKEMPMCGFSATVVKVLSMYGLDYKDVNVLEDPNIRIKISEHSNWPTIPQLYVNGEFIGGADIMREMFESGELKQLLHKLSEHELSLWHLFYSHKYLDEISTLMKVYPFFYHKHL